MLPAIKEDLNSQVVNFTPRSVSRKLKSRCKVYLDLLQKKLKQIQGPKIKYPELLIEYFDKKRKKTSENLTQLELPGMQDIPSKFKALLCQTDKKKSGDTNLFRKPT